MEKVSAMTASVVGYMMRTALHNNKKLQDQETYKHNRYYSLINFFKLRIVGSSI